MYKLIFINANIVEPYIFYFMSKIIKDIKSKSQKANEH